MESSSASPSVVSPHDSSAEGDQQSDEWIALDTLFRAEFDGLYRFCVARTGSKHGAEEAVSHTFAEAARLFASGRADEVHAGWLYTVAKRRIIDNWRTEERNRQRIDRLRRQSRPEFPADSSDLDVERILRALESLPSRQRAALSLRYLEEHSVSDVADVLGESYKTTESLLSRGRRGFSRAYEEQS